MFEPGGSSVHEIIGLELSAGRGERIPSLWKLSLARVEDKTTLSWVARCHETVSCPRGYLDSVKQRQDLFSRLNWPFVSDSLHSLADSDGGLRWSTLR
jgi:hypothetical protein